MSSRSCAFALVLSLLLCSMSLQAATFIVPSDRELAKGAEAIVIAVAGESFSEQRAEGIYTRTSIRVEESIKGPYAAGAIVDLVGMGGEVSGRFELVTGVPRFGRGERVLLFLASNRYGEPAVYGWALGRFSWRGEILVRDVDRVELWSDAAGTEYREIARDARRFVQYLRHLIEGGEPTADYFLPLAASWQKIEPNAFPATAYMMPLTVNGQPSGFRWSQFDSGGGVGFGVSGAGASGFADPNGGIDRAMAAWNNEPNSSVSLDQGAASSDGFESNGRNTVVFAASLPPEAGGGAVGFASVAGGTPYSQGGITWIATSESDVIVKNGFTSNGSVLDAVIAHELGHSLGFRHSGDSAPATSNALMNEVVPAGGATLRQWDIDAVSTVYGAGPVCTAPSITTQPQSKTIESGTSTNLTVSATGTTPLTFQWFRAASPLESNPVGNNSSTLSTGVLTADTSFWVKVTNSCGSANSQTATVTMAACQPPAIIQHPQSTTITSGSSATLSVAASGSQPLTVQWFRGESGNTSTPVGNGASFNTGALTTETSFWARVSNSCGNADSNTATISVAPCDAPQIVTQPLSQTVTTGSRVTLTVNIVGSQPLAFQWFEGESGDTARPVSTNPSFLTPTLTATKRYWVRVSNSCGSANSDTAVLTVAASCTPPAITAHPAGLSVANGGSATLSVTATGTSLAFQWFRGESGNTSSPVSGATSATLNTGPLAQTTTFWVRVTNSCGSANSNSATVTVAAACAISITRQPASVTVRPGTRMTLSVIASGEPNLTYQWFSGAAGNTSTPISGATTASLKIGPITQTASFWVRVTAACGSVNSSTATITVGKPLHGRPVRR